MTKRDPHQQRSIDKKERIISAAYKLMSKFGILNIGIRDIAEMANVSTGIVYSYFKDKNDIFHEVHKRFDKNYYGSFEEELIKELPDNNNLEEIVYILVKKIEKIAKSNKKQHREFIILSLIDKNFNKEYEAIKNRSALAIGKGLFNKFSDLIEVSDPDASAVIVQKAVDEIIKYTLLYDVKIPNNTIIDETVKMITRYLEKK